jgi:hypothetical protein
MVNAAMAYRADASTVRWVSNQFTPLPGVSIDAGEIVREHDPRQFHTPIGMSLRSKSFRVVQEADGEIKLVLQSFILIADRCPAIATE